MLLVVDGFHEEVDFAKVVGEFGGDDAGQLPLDDGYNLEQIRVARVALALSLLARYVHADAHMTRQIRLDQLAEILAYKLATVRSHLHVSFQSTCIHFFD